MMRRDPHNTTLIHLCLQVDATDAEGGHSSSSADESDVSGTVRIHDARSRKRKLARSAGVSTVPSGTLIRKRGRRRQGSGGSGAIQEGLERERLDWPSTIIPRTPHNIPLLLSCLSTYPDKAREETLRWFLGYQSRMFTEDDDCVDRVLISSERLSGYARDSLR